ncbi:amidase [Massarina eburnea CBS 473.64]|uniref:Amidase n=1 Tax=Massarina eburnea CBS 473.64 TaxID=1395130 RepID=A0A6A6S0I2_9PLEO|nr:amidase [Massarina eburnea CBS 473.64]
MTTTKPPTWQTLAATKRTTNVQKMPKEWRLPTSLTSTFTSTSTQSVLSIPRTSNILSDRELELTEKYDATALVEMMSSGKVKSVDVVTAFCKRAAVAQQCVNCLTEIMFEEAIERAGVCDGFVEREGRGMGALHGLPISLKDSFNIKGTQATIGYITFLDHAPSPQNSNLVTLLQAAGAIIHCKTNLPQTMMAADTHNNLFGRTLNPHNLSLTAGGSSGGEAALLAMRGSVLGIATDIAGSCRIPALCCGLKSFKPSAGRVPFGGKTAPGRLGSPASIVPVIGPMGRSVRDAELVLSTVCTGKTWDIDESVLNVPWRSVEPVSRPLVFGLVRGHAKRPLHPPVARALHAAATKLKEAGHRIVLLDHLVPDLWDCAVLAWKYFLLDPRKTDRGFVDAAGEPLVPSIAKTSFRELDAWEPSLDGLFDLNVERWKVLKKYHDLVVENGLDAVLTVGYQGTAPPHDQYGVTLYTVLQNLLNYPSGMFPFLKANKELDAPFFKSDAAYEPPYNAEACEGLPAHIQVMGKPMQDEELMEILKVVEGIVAED